MQKIIIRGIPTPDQTGEVAQSVERETENLCVGGSIPSLAILYFCALNIIITEAYVFLEFSKTADSSHDSPSPECHINKRLMKHNTTLQGKRAGRMVERAEKRSGDDQTEKREIVPANRGLEIEVFEKSPQFQLKSGPL